ncbi:MAG: kinase [Synergistaceae bacterium]|nr:kinase [Synergistaceae bacterium]
MTLRIETGSRLHLGFLDLHGGLGRKFASVGVAIDRPRTVIEASPSTAWSYEGPEAFRSKAEGAARRLTGTLPPLAVKVVEAARAHVGFGSGTQVALAVGSLAARLLGRDGDVRTLAGLLGRGRRSGVGVEAFAAGGFIVDGGLKPGQEGPPPLLMRCSLPETWRFLLAVPDEEEGLSGPDEEKVLATMAPPSPDLAEALCRLVLMVLLPALVEADGEAFGSALTEIQRLVGSSFAAAQGGIYASSHGEELLAFMTASGARGVGQSSWGPALFGFFDDPLLAERALETMNERGLPGSPDLILARPLNEGARISGTGPFRKEVRDAFSRC